MSATVHALNEPEDGQQLDFFDSSIYKTNLFSVGSTNKHHTDLDLRPGQHVSGRFTGAVVGLSLEGFASETSQPTKVFKISADYVELD